MKTRMTIFASLLLAGFTFTSCDDNDDNYTPDEKIVNVLYEKYPNAQRVDWELQHDHYVADFYDNNIEKEVIFCLRISRKPYKPHLANRNIKTGELMTWTCWRELKWKPCT